MEHLRRDISEKSQMTDLLELKAKLMEKIDSRVELREV